MSVLMISICLMLLVPVLTWGKKNFIKTRGGYACGPANQLSLDIDPNFVSNHNEQDTPGFNGHEKSAENTLWMRLSMLDQLQLSILLIRKALPVWEKYALSHETSYRDAPAKSPYKIDDRLLQRAIDEIATDKLLFIPGDDNKNIYRSYLNFIGPVIAMQDGNWVPPYPVKKIFLSVYYVLKCIMEQKNESMEENFLAISISQSLDCLSISKLYGSEEIAVILEQYKNKVQ